MCRIAPLSRTVALHVTFDVLKTALLKPNPKPIGTLALHAVLRSVNEMHYAQVKALSGTTLGTYAAWTKKRGLPQVVEGPLVDDAYLYWIGPKRTGKVILYVHGELQALFDVCHNELSLTGSSLELILLQVARSFAPYRASS